jgi:uncharacterized protein YdbL (DUF1318 family)
VACSDGDGGKIVMRRTYRLIVCVIVPTLLLGTLWLPLPSWGLTLEEAKTQGMVGEQPNGYVGIVQPGASAEVQALVNDVNQKRRQTYEDIARRNATKLEAVEMLAGKTAIDNTKPGNFIRRPSGQWVKK